MHRVQKQRAYNHSLHYLFDLSTYHRPADVNDKYDIFGNHWEPFWCKIMHKISVVHLKADHSTRRHFRI